MHLDEWLARRPSQKLRDLVGHRLVELYYYQVLKVEAFHECPDCGELKRPHNLCTACGHYNGREIVSVGL